LVLIGTGADSPEASDAGLVPAAQETNRHAIMQSKSRFLKRAKTFCLNTSLVDIDPLLYWPIILADFIIYYKTADFL
jgi:hypothetical protein